MRRMLDPKEAGGSLPSTITFDEEGNRTVGKNLGVDGKLTLKSLVSESNPDGDITKELGGGGGGDELYCHCIVMKRRISTNYYNHSKTPFDYQSFKQAITDNNKRFSCSGLAMHNNQYYPAISRYEYNDFIFVHYLNPSDGSIQSELFGNGTEFTDYVLKVI